MRQMGWRTGRDKRRSARSFDASFAVPPDNLGRDFDVVVDEQPGPEWPRERPCGIDGCQKGAPCTYAGCWRRPAGYMGSRTRVKETSTSTGPGGNAGMVMLAFITVSLILMIFLFYFLYMTG